MYSPKRKANDENFDPNRNSKKQKRLKGIKQENEELKAENEKLLTENEKFKMVINGMLQQKKTIERQMPDLVDMPEIRLQEKNSKAQQWNNQTTKSVGINRAATFTNNLTTSADQQNIINVPVEENKDPFLKSL